MKNILLLLVFLSVSKYAEADIQIDSIASVDHYQSSKKYYFGLSVTNCVPQKDFQDNIKTSGIGFSFYGGAFLLPIPVSIGLNFDVIYFSYDPSISLYDGFDVISTKTTAVPINLVLRFQPLEGKIIPFFEGFGGFTVFSASSEYQPSGSSVEPFSESRVNSAFNYGLSGGILFRLVKSDGNEKGKRVSIFSEIRARYIFGDFSDYNTVYIDSNEYPVFVSHASKTNMINVHIGFTFIF